MKRLIPAIIVLSLLAACTHRDDWTESEKELIENSDSVMRVLSIFDPADSVILRASCSDIADVGSELCGLLSAKMLATVKSPQQSGVGIAAPQVGISRRMVAVMRYDKAERPFEVFPNIRITSFNGEKAPGPEGCLSVPGYRGIVNRYRSIDIAYTSLKTLADTTEHVEGYTAIIFQHECDHLDGIVYTDKADSVSMR